MAIRFHDRFHHLECLPGMLKLIDLLFIVACALALFFLSLCNVPADALLLHLPLPCIVGDEEPLFLTVADFQNACGWPASLALECGSGGLGSYGQTAGK